MTVLILTTVFTGSMNRSEKVWGSDTEPETPCITQTAAWTDKEQGTARLDIGIQGLKTWLDEKYPEEDEEENTGKDVTGDRDKEGEDPEKSGMDTVGAIVEYVNTEGDSTEETGSTESVKAAQAQGAEHAEKKIEQKLNRESENDMMPEEGENTEVYTDKAGDSGETTMKEDTDKAGESRNIKQTEAVAESEDTFRDYEAGAVRGTEPATEDNEAGGVEETGTVPESNEVEAVQETGTVPENSEMEAVQETGTVPENHEVEDVQETEAVPEVEEPEILEGPEDFREFTDRTDREDSSDMEEEETDQWIRCPEQLKVITVISRYFQADMEKLPDNCQAEEISWKDKEGESQRTTKLLFTLDTAGLSGEEHIMVPVTVKEEFRYPALSREYPLTETEDISGDDGTYGTYLCMEEMDGMFILRSADAPALEVKAAEAGLTVTIRAESSLMKAGETLRYKVEVQNTGHLKLEQIKLSSIFSCPKIRQKWKEAEGLTSKGGEALLTQLQEGEKRSFHVLAPLENEQERDLTHRVEVTGNVSGRDETLKREVSLTSSLVPLKADFTVKKTADRDTAEPGDKVTYQICIINTGEKTLHSVVGTEQFRQEGVFAYFMEDKGIRLSHDKTKAYIEKIAPGEAISLRASVTIPEKTVSSRLLNRVAVTALETGSREVSASSEIAVRKRAAISPVQQADFTETPVPASSTETEENYEIYGEKDTRAVPASTHPKTGDDSGKDGYILLLVVACVAGMGAVWLMVHYRRMKADK